MKIFQEEEKFVPARETVAPTVKTDAHGWSRKQADSAVIATSGAARDGDHVVLTECADKRDFWDRRYTTAADHQSRQLKKEVGMSDRPVFAFSVILGVGLGAAKVWQLGPQSLKTVMEVWAYIHNISVVVHEDLLFATLLGLFGWLCQCATRPAPRLRQMSWMLWVGLCMVCMAYGAISAYIVGATGQAITFEQLRMDGLAAITGPLARLPGAVLTGLLLSPVLFLIVATGATYFMKSFFGGIGSRALKIALILTVAMVSSWAISFKEREGQYWHFRSDRNLSQNPHWILLRTTAQALTGNVQAPAK